MLRRSRKDLVTTLAPDSATDAAADGDGELAVVRFF
jgi:hypothetical protein